MVGNNYEIINNYFNLILIRGKYRKEKYTTKLTSGLFLIAIQHLILSIEIK